MDAADTETSFFDIYGLDESEREFASAIRPLCKDATEFGRACRSLATPEKRREEAIVDSAEEDAEELEFGWSASDSMAC